MNDLPERKNKSHLYKAVIAVFALAFLVRLGYLLMLRSSILFSTLVVDAAMYDLWGLRIAQGDWLGGDKAFYDPPLYAYFLGAVYRVFGHSYLTARIVQVLVGSFHCVVICLLGARILDRRAGLVAGIAAALYKPLIYFDGAFMKAFLTSTLVDTMILVLLVAFDRRKKRWWFLAGLLLGLLATIRVNMLAFAALGLCLFAYAFAFGKWFDDRRTILQSFGTWALALVLVLLPVGLRNLKVSGQFIIVSSYLGQNFYTGNNSNNTSGNYQRLPFVRANPKYEEEDFRRAAMERTGRATLTPREISDYWMGEAIKYIIKEPGAFLGRLALRFKLFWNAYEIPDTDNIEFEARYFTHYLRLPFLGFGFIAPLGLIGAALMWSSRRRLWPLYVFAPFYMLTIIPFFVFARYRLPVTGTLLAFAGAAAVSAWDGRPNLKRTIAVGSAFLALVLLVNLKPPHRVPDSEGFLNLGTIYFQKGDLNKAESLYRRALEQGSQTWEANYFLATTLRQEGKCDEAIKYYAAAFKIWPGLADALGGIAICLDESGDYKNAKEFYLKALQIEPGLSEIRLKLIHLLIKNNETESAIEQIKTLLSIDPQNNEALELKKRYNL